MNMEGLANRLRYRYDQLSAYEPVDLGDGQVLPAEDVLDGHFTRLAGVRSTQNVTVQIGPDLHVAITVLSPSLTPLTNLAEDLVDAVPPVEPGAKFRNELQKALEMTYRQHAAQRRLGTRPIPSDSDARNTTSFSLLALLSLLLMLLFLRLFYGRGEYAAT